MEENTKESRFLKVELGNYISPVFIDSARKDWVSYGKYNEYPYFLIALLNQHPEHGAIVRGKSAYVFGKGLHLKEDVGFLNQAKGEQFLQSANRFETWDEVIKKSIMSYQLYNGWAWQIVWKNDKRTFETFHIEFGKLRRSKNKRKVYYCDEWMIEQNGKYVPNPNPEKSDSYKCFDIFNPNIRTGTQIFLYHDDVPNVIPNGELYPLPEYEAAILQIETDIEISKLRYNYAKWGMFAQSLLSFFNGEPDAKEKKAIKKMFDRTYGGADNAGSIIFSFNDKGGTAPTLTTLTQSDLDKVFMDTRKECQDKIFSAHLTAPVLFGIKTEGSLSDTSGQAILKEWDKFVKTYIEYRQNSVTKQIINIAGVQGVDLTGLYFEQTTPVGLDLPSDPNVLALFNDATKRKYFAAKYGIDIVEEEGVTPNDPSIPAVVNENLKKLSGRDWQHIKRLVREVSNGKTTKEVASMMLKNGYALTDQDIEVLFKPNLNFSKFTIEKNLVKDVLLAFEKCAIKDDPDDEVVSEELMSHEFAELPYGANGVLDILKGNPLTTPEQIANQTGLTTDEVQAILDALKVAGLINLVGALIELTPKAIAKPTEPLEQVETYSVYKYVTRPDVPKAETSREFCREMLRMTREGYRWTREAIDDLSNGFGFSVWNFRGGWYTNPDDGETTKWCRHTWERVTKTRKKKK